MSHNLEQQLATFRATHWPRRVELAGASWSYIVGGAGPATMLLLPGAPGIAEMAFPYILAFEPSFRVIAPSYPAAIGTLDQLLDGLTALLAAEAEGPVCLVGASYSGLVAQSLLHRDPARVRYLLIGDTGVASPARAQPLSLAGAALAALPPAALHGAFFAILAVVLWGHTPDHRFWQRYFKGVVASLSGRDLANRVQVMVDIDRHGAAAATPAWHGPTLLIENRLDPLFSPRERAALRARFPQAEVHALASRSHITALTRSHQYIRIMRAFLDRHAL